ncbi:MAG: hypothetical protein L0Y72_06920 [Gemmataceae bacterium]|nr:hypothetical protein [Gemmataceae bacterium]MCI0738757.1 hypothetical protein [Gemmataceae bacterium]
MRDDVAPDKKRRFSRCTQLCLLVFGSCVLAAAWLYRPALSAFWVPRLLVRDVVVDKDGLHRNSQLTYSRSRVGLALTENEGGPALWKLGPPPTPVSIHVATENSDKIVVFLYEQLGSLRVLLFDKKTLDSQEIVLRGSRIAYQTVWDRRDPSILWIAASMSSALYRLDCRTAKIDTVAAWNKDDFLFGLDADADGNLYVGTHPEPRCWKVNSASAVVEEVPVDRSLLKGCAYVHGLFVAGESLLVHAGSPGKLLRHDLQSAVTELLLETTIPFLVFERFADFLRVHTMKEELYYDRRGRQIAEPQKKPQPSFTLSTTLDAEGKAGTRECLPHGTLTYQGRTASFSLAPREGGMSVTTLAAGPRGRIYGGAYWNNWLFELRCDTGELRGLGRIPEGGGEFFHLGRFQQQLIVPHYHGYLFLFDPARPFSALAGGQSGEGANPEKIAHIDKAHWGAAGATAPDGRFVYGTAPNYHQYGGILVTLTTDKNCRIWDSFQPDCAIRALAFLGDRLYGIAAPSCGLGVQAKVQDTAAWLVVLDDAKQKVEGKWLLSAGGDAYELVALNESSLLAAGKKKLFVVEAACGVSAVSEVSSFKRFRQLHRCSIHKLLRYSDDWILVLTNNMLFAFAPRDHSLHALCHLPVDCRHLAADESGNLALASENCLYLLPGPTLAALLPN